MSASTIERETRVEGIPGLTNREAMELGDAQMKSLISELRDLSDDDWLKPTDCERWAVRDVVAHILGWAEAVASPREMVRLSKAARKVRDELNVKLDAQNEAQVIARRNMTPRELIEALERASDAFMRMRRTTGLVGRGIPIYSGPIGLTNVRFLMGQIFTRDHFMHRIDIARATDKELAIGNAEVRIVTDIVRHWARSSKADARLVLTGPAEGTFIAGDGNRATISGDAIEFCRLLAGRAPLSAMDVEGNRGAAQEWLAAKVPF